MGEKWIGRSRRLWAVVLTAGAGAAEVFGWDVSDVLPMLEEGGNQLAALAATGLALWSRFRPDDVRLKASPSARNLGMLLAGLGVPALLFAAGAARADERCDGEDPACTMDWTDGGGAIEVPAADADGDAYPEDLVIACEVDMGLLGVASVEGAPGSVQAFDVPKGEPFVATGTCWRKGVEEASAPVVATASPPPFREPGRPALRPE